VSVGRIGYQSPLAVAVQGVQVDRYYPVVTAAEGASQAYGAYAQVVASTAANIYLIGMAVGSTEPRNSMGYAAIGTGGAGAETVIAEVAYYLLSESAAQYVRFTAPIPVASGTRVAVKVTSTPSSVTVYDHKVALHYAHQTAVA